jgi:hypothetical protein
MPGLRRLCCSLLLLILSCIELGLWSGTAGLLLNTVRCIFGLVAVMLSLLWKTSKGQNATTVIYRFDDSVIDVHFQYFVLVLTCVTVHSMETSIGQFVFAVIFLSLCIIMFAVIGQTLFAGVKRGPGNVSISNFTYKFVTL